MSWSISSGANSFGGTETIYQLDFPGLGLGAVETVARDPLDSASNWGIGAFIRYYSRTMVVGVITTVWSLVFRAGLSTVETGGYRVETVSLAGSTTAQCRPLSVANAQGASYTNGSNQIGYYDSQQLERGGETWGNLDSIYGYVKSDGTTAYTKSLSLANSVGGKRWLMGIASIASIIPLSSSTVLLRWGDLVPNQASGNNKIPGTAISAAFLLGDSIYTTLEGSLASPPIVATGSVFLGQLVAVSGTGAATLGYISTYKFDGVNNGVVCFSSTSSTGSLVAQSNSNRLGNPDITGYADFIYSISITVGGGIDTLKVKIPFFGIGTPNSTLYNINIPDFSIDVTLPFPIGDARIVWSGGPPGKTAVENGGMFPAIVRRTVPGVAPETYMVRNNLMKSDNLGSINYNFKCSAVVLSGNSNTPYVIGSARTDAIIANIMDNLGCESFINDTVTVLVPSYVGVVTLAQWAYIDCSSGARALTRVGSTCAMTLGYAGAAYSGSLPSPTMPSDYRQGSMLIMYFVGGSWTTGSGINSSLAVWCLTNYIKLPVYPFNTSIPAWITSDADIVPVANSGWMDSTPRDMLPTVTWGGALSMTYLSPDLKTDITGITASITPSKMHGSLVRGVGYLIAATQNGTHFLNAFTNQWHDYFQYATISGTGLLSTPAPRPSVAANYQIYTRVQCAFLTSQNSCSTAYNGGVSAIYEANVVIP